MCGLGVLVCKSTFLLLLFSLPLSLVSLTRSLSQSHVDAEKFLAIPVRMDLPMQEYQEVCMPGRFTTDPSPKASTPFHGFTWLQEFLGLSSHDFLLQSLRISRPHAEEGFLGFRAKPWRLRT